MEKDPTIWFSPKKGPIQPIQSTKSNILKSLDRKNRQTLVEKENEGSYEPVEEWGFSLGLSAVCVQEDSRDEEGNEKTEAEETLTIEESRRVLQEKGWTNSVYPHLWLQLNQTQSSLMKDTQ